MKVVSLAILLVVCLSAPAFAEAAGSAWDVKPVLVGTKVPDISFVAEGGEVISLRERAAEKPLVLVVYRGLW